MLVVLDVAYQDTVGVCAAVCFDDPADSVPSRVETFVQLDVPEYVPGEFWRRELPCLIPVLEKLNLSEDTILIVDGYCWLAPDRPGLGEHTHQQTGYKVIGIAKTRFQGAVAHELARPGSQKPLWVTWSGMQDSEALAVVERLSGPYRIPTMLRLVDQTCRQALADYLTAP